MSQTVIDNPIELLVYILIVLAVLMILFKFNNWMDARPIKEKKVKEKKSKPNKSKKVEPIKETIKEVVKDSNNDIKVTIDKDAIIKEVKEQVYNDMSSNWGNINNYTDKKFNNYLYDRFVVSPSDEDFIENNKSFDGFISDEEHKNIRDRNIKIPVKDDDISNKEKLYKRIEELTSKNFEEKEKMLKDFESLPKSMKLLLIENIMEKM